MALRPATEARILDAAEELFFKAGIAATPVDAVLARAGVSAATLYRGWRSKEALVAAALERRHAAWLEAWDAAVRQASDPEQRVLAVYDALDAFRGRPSGSRWCAFLASSAEYTDAPVEVATAVRLDTDALRGRLARYAGELVGDDAAARDLAEQLLLVLTGDLAMRLRGADSTRTARTISAALVAAARTR